MIVIEMRSFIGLARYYHHFVKDFSRISTPLTKSTGKGVKFLWNDESEISFQKLKECVTSTLELALPFETEWYVVYCEASRVGLGCVLM